ncbi:hypothetical protein BBD46_06920 [Natrialba sp. SSL1]|nr:hypothetical protein BBD46_06920 [Natrialba sp. SSL1]
MTESASVKCASEPNRSMNEESRLASLAGVRSRWSALERDWQSVVVGATVVALVSLLDVHIPWSW